MDVHCYQRFLDHQLAFGKGNWLVPVKKKYQTKTYFIIFTVVQREHTHLVLVVQIAVCVVKALMLRNLGRIHFILNNSKL